MKPFRSILLLAAAAIVMAACSKVDLNRPEAEEIRFQVAGYRASAASTKAPDDYRTGYDTVPFGAYAWFKGVVPEDNAVFMVNEKVMYFSQSNIWTTASATYYWPKWGSLDFICYSPYSDTGVPVVEENAISYDAWDVSANPDIDLMYADKATGLTDNVYTYYSHGIPVLFRHALAKVAFTMRLAYSEMTPETGDKTKWEVTLNSITLKDIRTKGSLGLTLENGAWVLPTDRVWENDGTSRTDIDFDCSGLAVFKDTELQTLSESRLVLPQTLNQGQKIVMNFTIKTWRDTGNGYPAEPFIQETSVEMNASLSTATMPAWRMNQSIKYNLILAPSLTADGVKPVEITFDPAEADWETIELNTQINL